MKRWFLYEGILLAVLGLLLIIFPTFWVKLVVILLGIGSIGYGIYSLKYTKSLYKNTHYERSILIKSIISIAIGFLVVVFPLFFAKAAWTVMMWILIIYLIATAVLGFYAASLLKDTGIERKRYFIENIILLVIAIALILLSPAALGKVIIRIVGIASMVLGLGLVIYDLVSKKDVTVVSEYVDTTDTTGSSDSDE
ncbi:MAG: DUF308 domain-containing protein [Treponema sp.]|nr:DUF308 domain-containing protein [Treponema sp.]MCI7566314.1 DUF308 domain-containing protein [Treponema sp.]